jgi:hypothetical protein
LSKLREIAQHSKKINMLKALLAIADRELNEKRKPKGAECAKGTEGDGAVKMGAGEGEERGGGVAKRGDEKEQDGTGHGSNEMRCEEGADGVPSTHEDDKDFYSSQESFQGGGGDVSKAFFFRKTSLFFYSSTTTNTKKV